MNRKALLTALFALLIFTGCGYKIVLTGKDAAFKIYPSSIENLSDDLEATSLFSDEIRLYLATINGLGTREKADYTGEFTLVKLNSSGSSSSSSTTTEYARLSITINIKDQKGNEVYSKTINSFENYDNTANQSETRSNREYAIKEAISKAMTDFRNAFEQRK
ncbi:MAG: hypothetical protein C0603_01370 [Denitrovibrio sp.]|nr:MAG: hypothetical protein C0603_01370 [Denitrovibrio sp.]